MGEALPLTTVPLLSETSSLFRLLVMVVTTVLVWRFCARRGLLRERSWRALLVGFIVLSVASIVDVSDTFPVFDPWPLLGRDLAAEAFEIGAYTVGIVLVIYGVWTVLPLWDRLQAQNRALRESESRYQSLIEQSHQGILLIDVDSLEIVDCNPQALVNHRCARSELVGTSVLDHVPARQPDGRPSGEVVKELRRRLERGPVENNQFMWRRRDGSSFLEIGSLSELRIGDRRLVQTHSNPVADSFDVDELLERLARVLSGTTDQAFFDSLALQLSRMLNCADVMIARLVEGPPRRLSSLARVIDGRLEGAFEMRLVAGTESPMAAVLAGRTQLVADNLQELYPQDEYFRSQGLTSYIGIPIRAASGAVIGIITMIDRRNFADPLRVEYLLEIFGARIGAEVERQAASAALAESEQRLRLATRAAGVWSWEWSVDSDRLLLTDPSGGSVGGDHDRPRRIDTTLQAWLAGPGMEGADAVRRALNTIVAQPRPLRFEYAAVGEDGRRHVMQSAGERLRNGQGEFNRVVGATWEVTELHRQQEALRVLAQGYTEDVDAFLERSIAAAAGLFDVHLAGILCRVDDRPGWVSSRARWRRGDMTDPLSFPIDGTVAQRALETGQGLQFDDVPGEFPHDAAAAESDCRAIIAEPLLSADGDCFGLFYLGADRPLRLPPWAQPLLRVFAIRFAAEIELHSSLQALQSYRDELEQKVAERTRELEDFCHSVSHDLRQPLRALDGFSQALIEDHGEALDAQGLDYLQRVRMGAQRMSRIIDDLLALASLTRREMYRRDVDLSRIAGDAIDALQAEQPAREVHVVVAPDLYAWADRALISAALNHLLGNAWKYTQPRQHAVIEFGAEEQDGERVFYVRDNGVGFDMSFGDKLFGAFQRLHSHGQFEGSGIGLASVRRIVNRHGGRIWAESAPDQGATFYFTIPGRSG